MISGTKISIETGSEGPRHDPYAWHEVIVERWGKTTTLHGSGLGNDWLKVEMEDGKSYHYSRFDPVHPMEFDDLVKAFVKLTGMDPGDAEHWHHVAESRCPKCGKPLACVGSGYVGEGVYACTNKNCDGMRVGEVTEAMIE